MKSNHFQVSDSKKKKFFFVAVYFLIGRAEKLLSRLLSLYDRGTLREPVYIFMCKLAS